MLGGSGEDTDNSSASYRRHIGAEAGKRMFKRRLPLDGADSAALELVDVAHVDAAGLERLRKIQSSQWSQCEASSGTSTRGATTSHSVGSTASGEARLSKHHTQREDWPQFLHSPFLPPYRRLPHPELQFCINRVRHR